MVSTVLPSSKVSLASCRIHLEHLTPPPCTLINHGSSGTATLERKNLLE